MYPVTGHCLRRLLLCPLLPVRSPGTVRRPFSFLVFPSRSFSLFFFFSLYVLLFSTHSVLIRLSCIFIVFFFLLLTRSVCAVLDRSHSRRDFLHASTAAAGSRLARAPARFSRSSLSYSRHLSVLVALGSESCPQRAEALPPLSITRPSLGALSPSCRRQVLRSPSYLQRTAHWSAPPSGISPRYITSIPGI